jgi:hypothetical protein
MAKRAHKRTKAGHVTKARHKINHSVEPRCTKTAVLECGTEPTEEQKNTTVPCDVTGLGVKVTMNHDAIPIADFKTDHRRINEAPPEKCPSRIAKDLSNYDFVIETVSADETMIGSDSIPDWLSIAEAMITDSWMGKCPLHMHPRTVVHALDSRDRKKFEDEWGARSNKVELPARVPDVRDKEFGWTKFPKAESMALEVRAASCGVRFDTTPINELKALLRIFPRDDWSIKLKLPPGRDTKKNYSLKWDGKANQDYSSSSSTSVWGSPTKKDSYSETRNKDGVLTDSSETRGKGDSTSGHYSQTTEKMKTDKKTGEVNYAEEETTVTGNPYGGHTHTRDTFSTAEGDLKDTHEHSGRMSLTVSRNGGQIDASKILNTIINCVQKTKAAFAAIKDALKKAPKVGFTFDVSLVLFEGTIGYQRGYRLSSTRKSDRYTAVTEYVDVSFVMKVIEASVELGFGLEITVPNIVDWFATKNIFEVIIKASGKASIASSINFVDSFQDDGQKEAALTVVPGVDFRLTAGAMLAGKGLKGGAGIRSKGFLMTGKITCPAGAPPTVSADIIWDAGNAYGYFFVDLGIWDKTKHFDVNLWDSRPLLHGQFPPKPA